MIYICACGQYNTKQGGSLAFDATVVDEWTVKEKTTDFIGVFVYLTSVLQQYLKYFYRYNDG